jgi:hypothetical protein
MSELPRGESPFRNLPALSDLLSESGNTLPVHRELGIGVLITTSPWN